jgi:hypothetical protein
LARLHLKDDQTAAKMVSDVRNIALKKLNLLARLADELKAFRETGKLDKLKDPDD